MAVAFEQIALDPGQSFRLLGWTDNVTDVQQWLPDDRRQKLTGAGERWHFHPEYELTLITKGSGKRFVGDHVANFTAPDLVLIGPNLPHCWSELKDSSGYAVQFTLDTDHPLGQLAELQSLDHMRRESVHGLHFSGLIVSRIEQAMRAMFAAPPIHRLAGFIDVLGEIASVTKDEHQRLSDTQFTLNHRDPHMVPISSAVAFILGHLDQDIHVEDLLRVTHMSKPTFSRQFKRHTGRSFIAFLNEVRIANAKRLLIETSQLITEIAFASGFRNLSHFNAQFRRILGRSPRDYRKRDRDTDKGVAPVLAT